MTEKQICTALRARKQELRLSDAKVGAVAGVHETSVRRVMNGGPTTVRTLLYIAWALGMNIEVKEGK